MTGFSKSPVVWIIYCFRHLFMEVHAAGERVHKLPGVRQSSAAIAAGGVECWDRRRPGKPQLRSPLSWGMTGSGALDSAQVRLSCV